MRLSVRGCSRRQEQMRHLFHPLNHLLPRNDRSETLQKIPFQIVVAQVAVKAA